MNPIARFLDTQLQNLGYIKAAQVPVTMLYSGEMQPFAGTTSRYSTWTDEQNERLAITSTWVYSDVNVIANEISQGVFGIYEDISEAAKPLEMHPLTQILERRPNPHMSQSFVWRYTAMWLLLRGEAYWWLVSDRGGDLQQVWPIPASHMEPIPDASNYIKAYNYTPINGQPAKEIPAEQVCFFRLPNPFEFRRGMSPISAYRLALQADTEAAKLTRNNFESGLSIRALVSLREGMSVSEFEIAKQDIITSQEEKDPYLITRGGDVKVTPVTISQKDAEFLSTRQFNRDEIDRIYGFPEGFWSVQANRANAEQAFATLVNLTIWPLMNMISEEITAQIVSRYYDPGLVGRFNDVRHRDRELDLKEMDSKRAVMTWNEAREAEGLTLLDRGDIPFIALKDLAQKWAEQQGILDKPEPPPQLQPFQAGPEPPVDDGEDDEEDMTGEGELPEDDMDPEQKALTDWQQLAIKRLDGPTPALVYLDQAISEAESYTMAAVLGHCRSEAEIKAVFAHREEYSLSALKAVLGKRDAIPPEQLALEDDFMPVIEAFLAAQAGRIATAARGGAVPDEAFWKNEETLLLAAITPFVENWAEVGIGQMVTNVLTPAGLGIDANVNARAATWAGKHALELARGLNKTTRELAKAKIKNWLQTGAPLSELETSLAEVIAPQWRASLIASTEVTRAFAAASDEIAKEYEVIKSQVWLTARDERVCPVCSELNGALKPVGDTYPGGYDGPPAHPRCRCGQGYQL